MAARLKRAGGHLRHVVEMIEAGAPCVDIARQLLAVERSVAEAKRQLIHDHIDHCLASGGESPGGGESPSGHDLAELKALTKLL
ncbi:metal-sensing transcriptional repressor [Rhodobacteraceae bacterium PA1-206B]